MKMLESLAEFFLNFFNTLHCLEIILNKIKSDPKKLSKQLGLAPLKKRNLSELSLYL